MKYNIPLISLFVMLSSCGGKSPEKTNIVATTAWTAAYALTAGATGVSVLAPYEMVHPSEYELRPGDIERLSQAKLIIYAGYEVMVNQIKTGLNIPGEKMLMISTSYKLEEMEKSVMQIAAQLGTEEAALKNLQEIRELLEEGRAYVKSSGLGEQPALVHFFQESFAREVGIIPAMIFGPAPPEPRQILAMTKTGAVLILDNAHNPVAGPVKDILTDAGYCLLLNFPGMSQTRTLSDVIRYNLDQIAEYYH